eukprot:scaffold177524_cov30-Tisochrysis_lutea.AAC.1
MQEAQRHSWTPGALHRLGTSYTPSFSSWPTCRRLVIFVVRLVSQQLERLCRPCSALEAIGKFVPLVALIEAHAFRSAKGGAVPHLRCNQSAHKCTP